MHFFLSYHHHLKYKQKLKWNNSNIFDSTLSTNLECSKQPLLVTIFALLTSESVVALQFRCCQYSTGENKTPLLLEEVNFTVYLYAMCRKKCPNTTQTIHAASSTMVAEVREILNRQQAESESRRERRSDDLTCPVCLADAQFPIETNCGHLFCGQCIITYWETGRWLGTVRCPSCRQQVTSGLHF